MKNKKNPHAVALGKIKTPKKAAASRENGKKGGRKRILGVNPSHERFPNVWHEEMRFRRDDEVKLQTGKWVPIQAMMIGMRITRSSAESSRVRRNGKVITVL